jgi:hypothetical protein
MPENQKRDAVDRMVAAYDRMLKQAQEGISGAHKETVPRLRELLDKTRDHMVELGELTREEATRVAAYVERDIKDLAAYIADAGSGLREWWRFDLRVMEERMLEVFSSVADQTSLQLREWAEQARRAPAYRTGEITGPGTLNCETCGEELNFLKAGRIPPCPKCGGTGYRRGTAQPPTG